MEARFYPGAGIAHDGNKAVQEDHRHGEDEEEQQDYADDGIVAVVEEVQVCAAQHDGEQGHKGVKNIVELLQHRQSIAFVFPQILPLCIESANTKSHQACHWGICRNVHARTHAHTHRCTHTWTCTPTSMDRYRLFKLGKSTCGKHVASKLDLPDAAKTHAHPA